MQTFVPFSDLNKSAQVLDRQRLGKQRVETMQLVSAILGIKPDGTPKTNNSWSNHPAALMWKNSPLGLLVYQNAMIKEWKNRSYKDTCWVKTKTLFAYEDMLPESIEVDSLDFLTDEQINSIQMPQWLGNEEVHSSHRSALLFKAPEHYSQFNWTEKPEYNYIWPVG